MIIDFTDQILEAKAKNCGCDNCDCSYGNCDCDCCDCGEEEYASAEVK